MRLSNLDLRLIFFLRRYSKIFRIYISFIFYTLIIIIYILKFMTIMKQSGTDHTYNS